MSSKQEQIKEAATLSEKLALTIVTSVRDSVGISKEQARELKTKCYDSVFDIVVSTYRIAARIKQSPNSKES